MMKWSEMGIADRVMVIGIPVLFVVAGLLVLAGVLLGEDDTPLMGVCGGPGPAEAYEDLGADMCREAQWAGPLALPIGVRPHHHTNGDLGAVAEAVDAINQEVGFDLFRIVDDGAPVHVWIGVPTETGWMDPGGDARLVLNDRDLVVACEVRVANTGTLLMTHDTLRHELYHCVGLAHDPEDDGSIMHSPIREYFDLRLRPRLRDDDRERLNQLYNP